MRKDLNKVLCEHERQGSSRSYRRVRHSKQFQPAKFDEDTDLPQRESMQYRHVRGVKTDRKDFSENLNPLEGVIRANVGRPYDKFYSELSKVFDKRSVINQHILQHLDHMLERDIAVRDGELYIKNSFRYGRGWQLLSEDSYIEFYVDPRDGIIKKNKYCQILKQEKRKEKEQKILEQLETERWIDNDNVLRLKDGVWYHYILDDLPKGRIYFEKPKDKDLFDIGTPSSSKMKRWDQLTDYQRVTHGIRRFEGKTAFDVVSQRHKYYDENSVVNIDKRYYASKQTASKKILKKAGIKD